jgi:hypothetical protein
MSACTHNWSMVNIRSGYLVVEGCRHCRGRCSFFSPEPVPPVDDYREGDHRWTHLGSFQAVKFDLKCDDCGEVVDLSDVMGLMLSTCRNPECEVARIAAREGQNTWVYVALCADSTHRSGKCIGEAALAALTDYFNARITSPGKRALVVPCIKCKSIDTCEGIIIADTGLTDIY